MREYLKKVFYITGEKTRELPWILMLYLLSLILELIGLSLIIPFIAVLQDPDKLNNFTLWANFSDLLGIESVREELLFLSGSIFFVFLLKTLLNIKIQSKILKFSYSLQHYLRVKLSKLFLSSPYLFHTKRRSNEIVNMIQTHVNQFSKSIVGSLIRVTGETLTLLAIFLFLIISYPVPTITSVVVLGMFGFIYDATLRKRLRQAGHELLLSSNEQLKSARQGINSLKESRILGCGETFHEKISKSSYRAMKVSGFVGVLQMAPRFILEFLVVAIVIFSTILMLLSDNTGEAIINSLSVFAVAAIRLLPTSNQILTNVTSIRYARKSLDELYSDIRELEQPIKVEGYSSPNLDKYLDDLFFSGISFTYPGALTKTLKGISLDLKQGEIVGLMGPSGAGKSTLVDLVLGLIDAQEGNITLNGQNIPLNLWNKHQLGAYIPQKPALLDETVAENVAFGEKNIDPERVKDALKHAQLWDFVSNLPEGIDTAVGEDAVLFSGGQRQRMALARAFYFDRPLIILDEATSALDKETEKEILLSIEAIKKDKTILIISHSEQPLQICDRVYHMSHGEIVKEERLKKAS